MASAPTGALGQRVDTLLMRTGSSCAGCRIEVRTLATLTMPADSSGYPDRTASVVGRPGGGFIIAPLADRATFALFSPAGRFERVLGRKGPGPGEYGFLHIVRVGRGDSLLALDAARRTLSFLTPDGSFVRSVRLAASPQDLIVLPPDGLVLETTSLTARGIGDPYRRLTEQGVMTSSFGSDGRAVRDDQPFDMLRAAASDGKNGVWSTRLNRYELQHWQVDGTRGRTLIRDVDWFQAWDREPPDPSRERPIPQILGIQRDDRGLIWVFIKVADAAWKPTAGLAPPSRREGRGGAQTMEDWDGWLDTIVEVIDPVTGEVLVSQRFGEMYIPSYTAGLASRIRDDRDIPDMTVHSFTLSKP